MATSLSDLELAPRTTDVDDVPVDKLLVLQFQNGGREAYAEIFERYRPLTERICYRILGNREDAQEAVQETMLRVLRGLETFNGRYQLQAWIARIATNVSVDMVRARARRPNTGVGLHDLDEHADAALDPGGARHADPGPRACRDPSSMSSPTTTERRWSCGSSRVARTRRSVTRWACPPRRRRP